MNSWQEVKLGEVGRIITGKTPRTSISENYGDDILFLTPSDDMTTKTIHDTIRKLSHLGLREVKNCLLPKGAICVSCIGSDLGKVVITSKNTVTNQQINSILPSSDYDCDFIYYSLLILGKELNYISKTSTAVPIVNKTSFSNYVLRIPPLLEQIAIAKILSSLDEKIEINNHIRKNLEEMAQLLFKSWFVNFEPFQDDEFVDSELGKIPQGWKVGKIKDLGDVVGGSTPSKTCEDYYTTDGIAWITPRDLSMNKDKFFSSGAIDITELGLKNSSARIMPKGTVLFSSRAPIGYITIAQNDITTNQGFKSVIPNENIGTEYVYCYLKNNLDVIESRASGSTFKEVSGSVMKQIPALIPSDEVLSKFSAICHSYFEQQQILEAQIRVLINMRDTLLPKLMSGETRVPLEEAD